MDCGMKTNTTGQQMKPRLHAGKRVCGSHIGRFPVAAEFSFSHQGTQANPACSGLSEHGRLRAADAIVGREWLSPRIFWIHPWP